MFEKTLGVLEYFQSVNESLGGQLAPKVQCNYVTQLKTQGVHTITHLCDMGEQLQFLDLPEPLLHAVMADLSRMDKDSSGEKYAEQQFYQRKSWTTEGYCLCTKVRSIESSMTLNCGHKVCKTCLPKYLESYYACNPASEAAPCPVQCTMPSEYCSFNVDQADHRYVQPCSLANSTRCADCRAQWMYPYTRSQCISCSSKVCLKCPQPHSASTACIASHPCMFCARAVVSGINDLQTMIYKLDFPSSTELKQKLRFPNIMSVPEHLNNVCDGQPSKGAQFSTQCPANAFQCCGKLLTCGCRCKGLKGETSCQACVDCSKDVCTQCTMPLSESCWLSSGNTDIISNTNNTNNTTPTAGTATISSNNNNTINNTIISANDICPHSYHLDCVKLALQSQWSGNRVSFTFLTCCCGKQRAHPAVYPALLPLLQLKEQVRQASEKRCIEDHIDCKDEYDALDQYVFYQCYQCKQAYHAGAVACQGSDAQEVDPALQLCANCSPPMQGACQTHGSEFQRHKCKYCCSVSAFGCWGNTYFCPKCHKSGEWQKLSEHRTGRNKQLLHEYKQCSSLQAQITALRSQDAFLRLTVFEQEERLSALKCDALFCPLRVSHPPNGVNFVLGCGACDSESVAAIAYETKPVPLKQQYKMKDIPHPLLQQMKENLKNALQYARNVSKARIHVPCTSGQGILHTLCTFLEQKLQDFTDASHLVHINSSNQTTVTQEQITSKDQGVMQCSPDGEDRYVELHFIVCNIVQEYIQLLPFQGLRPRYVSIEGSSSSLNQWVEQLKIDNSNTTGMYYVGSTLPISRLRVRFQPCIGFTEGYSLPQHCVEQYGSILLTHQSKNSNDHSLANASTWLIPYLHPKPYSPPAPSSTPCEEEHKCALDYVSASEESPQLIVSTSNLVTFLQTEWNIDAVQVYTENGTNVSTLLTGTSCTLAGAPPKLCIDFCALRFKCEEVQVWFKQQQYSSTLSMYDQSMQLVPLDNSVAVRYIIINVNTKQGGFQHLSVDKQVLAGVLDSTLSTDQPSESISKWRKNPSSKSVNNDKYIAAHSYTFQSKKYVEFAPSGTKNCVYLHLQDKNGILHYLTSRANTCNINASNIMSNSNNNSRLYNAFQCHVSSSTVLTSATTTSVSPQMLLTRGPHAFQTAPSNYPYICFDLGVFNRCDITAYSITRNGTTDIPVTWCQLGSSNGTHWVVRAHHLNDYHLITNTSSSWLVPPAPHAPPHRYQLLLATSANNYGNNILSIGGIEFYGTLTTSSTPLPPYTPTKVFQPSIANVQKEVCSSTRAICIQQQPSVPLPHLNLATNHPFMNPHTNTTHHPLLQPRTHHAVSFPPLISTYLNPTGKPAIYLCAPSKVPFHPSSILAFLGSSGGTQVFSCPVARGRLSVVASAPTETRLPLLFTGSPTSVCIPNTSADHPFLAIDTGALTQPTHFALRAGTCNFPKSFVFQGSMDASSWATLSYHINDACLSSKHAAFCYQLGVVAQKQWFRYYRWVHIGLNHSNNSNFTLGGVDLYGKIKVYA